MPPTWTLPQSPAIWRNPESDFYGDEPLNALEVYTEEKLRAIAAQGFNAIWLRGQLYDLMPESTIFPNLNRANAKERIQNLRELIRRGRESGIGVYLYFSEPLALPADSVFWKENPDCMGEINRESIWEEKQVSLCTSLPKVRKFLDEAIGGVLESLAGLAGVILITASEHPTHCWSRCFVRKLGDGFSDEDTGSVQCPRCASRQPAEIVAELLEIWAKAAGRIDPKPRILAWNWSWSMWYEDPQAQVIERLPKNVELMVDWERGGEKETLGKIIPIDEYTISYAGPSRRCLESLQFARGRGVPVHAKLQIGTTHEIATVPNLPLIEKLHEKLCGLVRYDIAGIMACWNFGCSLTLNSYAVGFFRRNPKKSMDKKWFMEELIRGYFGDVDSQAITRAWADFGTIFDNFPFSITFLYVGPMNYAPAYPLWLEYHDKPMGPSWIEHEPWGDRLEDCFGPFTLEEIIDALDSMAGKWEQALKNYQKALTEKGTDSTQTHRRIEELSCARMIGVHLKSATNIFRFHQWRRGVMEKSNLQPPCTVRMDERAVGIFSSELENVRAALELVESDARLGYHQECHTYMCSADKLREKINMLQSQLD